jgi:hypothetical protein
MAEWLTLLLLVPAIVAPVVLLVGFAGCTAVLDLDDKTFDTPDTPPPPEKKVIVIDSADGLDIFTIKLAWHSDFALTDLVFDRTDSTDPTDPAPSSITFDAQTSPFDDTNGLEAAHSYTYTLRDKPSGTKSSEVTGTTLSFETAFDVTGGSSVDQGDLQSITIVQRIEAAALIPVHHPQLKQARITLFASASIGASIDAIFISRASSAAGANPYDSDAPDLTAVKMPATPLVVPAGMSVTLVVDYLTDLDHALLVAIDYSAAPVSGVKVWTPMPAATAVAWFRVGPPEAGLATRSAGYASSPVVYLVGKIEVG